MTDKHWEISISDETALGALAARLAQVLPSTATILLSGTLGAGKTSFARAFIRSQCQADVEVVSPTFLLVQEYESASGAMVYHYDLYRIERERELDELGMDEVLGRAMVLVEWPSQVPGMVWPRDRLELDIRTLDGHASARTVVAVAHGSVIGKIEALLDAFQKGNP